jgi:hypothetical protein
MDKGEQMKKIGLICIASIIVLGGIGAGYALWENNLSVLGQVETGIASAQFEQVVSNDPSPGGGDPGGSPDPAEHGTWSLVIGVPVWDGTTYAQNDGATDASGAGTSILTVNMSNVYQCYYGSAGVTIKNTGTIPVIVSTVNTIVAGPVTDPDGDLLDIVFTGALVEATHMQIDAGDEVLGSVDLHCFNPDPDGTNYTVFITVTFIEWNNFQP